MHVHKVQIHRSNFRLGVKRSNIVKLVEVHKENLRSKNRTFGTVTLENIEQNSKPQDKRQYKKSQNRGSAQNSHAQMHI